MPPPPSVRVRRSNSRAVAVLLVFALAATGCNLGRTTTASPASSGTQRVSGATATPTGSAPASVTTGGTLTAAWVGPCCTGVDDLDPLTGGTDEIFLGKIYEHLVTYSIDRATHGYGSTVAELAASWTASSDGTSWTFHLRPNVRWHDGTVLTSADVAFSIALCLDPTTDGCTAAGSLSDIAGAASVGAGATTVSGVSTPDPATVTITTAQPDFAMLDTLSRVWILQQRSLAPIGRSQLSSSSYWTTPGQAVGTGPFRLSRFEQGKSVELSANAAYWRGAPNLARVVRLEFPDTGAAKQAFDAGSVDLTYLTPDEVAAEKANANATVVSAASGITDTLAFNARSKPFDDQKIRLAFAEAIDPQVVGRAVYGGAATPVPCLFGGQPYTTIQTGADPNATRARQLFQQGLQEEGFASVASLPRLTLDAGQTDQFTLQVLSALVQEWQSVLGVHVGVQQLAPAAWRERYRSGQSQISFAPIANGPDPNVGVTYFASASVWPRGENAGTDSAADTPNVDQQLAAARMSGGDAERLTAYSNACRAIVNAGVRASLWQPPGYWAVSRRVGGVLLGPPAPESSYDDEAQTWFIAK